MRRVPRVSIALLLAAAAVVGALALGRTLPLGAASRATSSSAANAEIARRTR
jgi:hypothetical protein